MGVEITKSCFVVLNAEFNAGSFQLYACYVYTSPPCVETGMKSAPDAVLWFCPLVRSEICFLFLRVRRLSRSHSRVDPFPRSIVWAKSSCHFVSLTTINVFWSLPIIVTPRVPESRFRALFKRIILMFIYDILRTFTRDFVAALQWKCRCLPFDLKKKMHVLL